MAETKYVIKLQDLASQEMKKIQAAMKAIEVSTGDTRKEFKELESSTKHLKKIEAQIAATSKESNLLAETWKRLDPTGFVGAELLASGIKAAFGAVVDFAKDSVKEFNDAQASIAKLSALTLTAGDSFSFSASQLNDLAGIMQSSLAIDDDLIRSAEGIFVSFQNISGEAFPRALQGAADMSTVFGSLESASTALGKALSQPFDSTNSLERIIGKFTKTEAAALTKMEELNDVAGAQDLILSKVEKRFGGTAKAMADSAAGDMKKADLALKDLQESFGGLVSTPVAAFANAMTFLFNQMSGAGPSLATVSLKDLREGVSSLEAQMKSGTLTATQYASALDLLQSAKNAVAAREHSYGQSGPMGAEVQTVEVIKAKAKAAEEAKAQAKELAWQKQSKINQEQETWQKEKYAADIADATAYWASVTASEKQAQDDERDAYALQASWDLEFEARDEAARNQKLTDEREAYELQLAWSMELDALDEEASKKQLERQDAFVSGTMSALGELANAWAMLSQQQIQGQIDAKEAQIQAIEDGLTETQREYEAELALKKAKGEDTTAFEIASLEGIKKAKAQAKAEEDKLKAEEKTLKRQAFEQDKAIKTAQTLMAGAQAVVQGYATMGPILGTIYAGVIAGVTAAQIGVIQGQAVPAMAEGGIVPATSGGRVIRVAEAGQAEAIIPLDRWGQLGSGGGDVFYISINGIQFQDAKDLALEIYQQTSKLKREGKIA